MSYGYDEQETLCHYDYLTDTWSIETNVARHITIVMAKYSDYSPKINSVNKNGKPTSVVVRGLPNVITFRTLTAIGKANNSNGRDNLKGKGK